MKKEWNTPLLTVIIRSSTNEIVLVVCKTGVPSNGPGNAAPACKITGCIICEQDVAS
jgi:hypothetical protein